MTLVTRSVELLLDRDPATAREQLGQLRDLQREALAEMRALIFELRPGNLEQDGLVRALKTHTSALQGRLGLPIVVESDLDRAAAAGRRGDALPDRPGGAPQRRQARRGQAGLGRASTRVGGGVRLRVQDDGRASTRDRARTATSGWPGMRARAERLGATFSCTSRPARARRSRSRSAPPTWPGCGVAGDVASRAARRVAVDPRRMT